MLQAATMHLQGWSDDMAFPILYKFTHRDSFVRFDLMASCLLGNVGCGLGSFPLTLFHEVFTMQFGQLWDFADGGAETSSGPILI